MRRQQNDDNNRYNVPATPPVVSPITQPNMPPAVSPITQPNMPPAVSPIKQPKMPPAVSPIRQPNMPPVVSPITQPNMPKMSPCPFVPPPGTAFNPIGVPPWAVQPGMSPIGGNPVTQPGMPSTGMPSTGMPPTAMPSTPGTPVDFDREPGPPVLTNDGYLQAHLKQYIGHPVKVEFILGTNMFIDREGTLIDVGIDHIVLRETRTDDLLFADFYSIKFVTILL